MSAEAKVTFIALALCGAIGASVPLIRSFDKPKPKVEWPVTPRMESASGYWTPKMIYHCGTSEAIAEGCDPKKDGIEWPPTGLAEDMPPGRIQINNEWPPSRTHLHVFFGNDQTGEQTDVREQAAVPEPGAAPDNKPR